MLTLMSIFPDSLFMGLSYDAWYTLVVVLCMFLTLMLTKVRADVAFLTTMAALFIVGVVDVKGAFGGFSSESVIVVAVLYVVIAGLTYTGVLNWLVKNVMGLPHTLTGAIVRLMLPVAALSSVLSNATVVALFINVVRIWSKKLGMSPSKLLIPLSYASGMGGICTLIGTPPNLIISGLYAEETGIQLSILTPLVCGTFCLFVGVLSMIAMQKMLPNRRSPISNGNAEDYTAELFVPRDNPFIGDTYAEIMKKLNFYPSDINIVAVRAFDGEYVEDISDNCFLMGGDRIIVTGKTATILRMCREVGLKNEFLAGILESDIEHREAGFKSLVSAVILIAMVLLSALDVIPMLQSCLMAAIAMVVCRCCTSSQAMKSIDWNIIIVFAGSVCIGKAIESTGIAQLVAESILNVCGSNPYVVITAICLVATFVTEFISNTAAGAMFYPIAMESAMALHVNPLTFCVALMISASSSFATPIGSPTHMLVYGPGGYRFTDFMRVGVLMNLIILAANIFITTWVFPF